MTKPPRNHGPRANSATGPFAMHDLFQALSDAGPRPLNTTQTRIIAELEDRMQHLDTIRKTAIEAYHVFQYSLSDKFQALRDDATQAWAWWNGEIMDQEFKLRVSSGPQSQVSAPRMAVYRRSRERCMAIADWATMARQFVRGAVEELEALCEMQRVQFAQVEKRVSDLRAESICERGAEVNIDSILFGFHSVSMHMEEELALPRASIFLQPPRLESVLIQCMQIVALPVSFKEHDYLDWPEDERALAFKANKLYDEFMTAATHYQLL